MRIQDLLFGRPPRESNAIDVGLLILRVVAGLALALLHGWGKVLPSPGLIGMLGNIGLPAPQIFAWLAMFAEFGGGLLLALGLLTRPVAFVLIGHFAVVVLLGHAGQTIGDRELPILFWAMAFQFLFTGAGRYSLDALIAQRRV